jgi:hypothetical protein
MARIIPAAGHSKTRLGLAILVWGALALTAPAPATAAGPSPLSAASPAGVSATQGQGGTSLETAASRAGDTGRKVAFSLIGLAFAVAAVVLCFKRDFKDAVAVFAIGILAVLLASPAGVSLLQSTVSLLFG